MYKETSSFKSFLMSLFVNVLIC